MIKLQSFEGPLDLLLHLIKKNEVDIYDIPIAMITEQYLEYLDVMRELNLEVVGDYLVIASELGLIKSRMLLPKPEITDGDQEEDPRAELVRRLIEYQRYKDAVCELLGFEILGRDVFAGAGFGEEDESVPANELVQADLWSLIDAFRELYSRRNYSWAAHIEFQMEFVTLHEKIVLVLNAVRMHKSVFFHDLFSEGATRFDLIITFLALLELVKNSLISVSQHSSYSSIQLVYLGEDKEWREVT
ncbi:MAG TPA: segregation/condensation protein A [Thermodesulfobacteriota bacterium]|nr:segregation/condensation protein A [Thermodesulfobacteriota bacterium]